MRVLICGTREYNSNNISAVQDAVKESGWDITEVVSGGAKGIDRAAILWAIYREIPCLVMPANWKRNGKSACIFQNAETVSPQPIGAVIAIPGKTSRLTYDLIAKATDRGIQIHVYARLL
jgi:hypothetical protein